jgi:hypothetical protein
MTFKIPVKRSATYTQPITLKIEKELKDKIKMLGEIEGANKPDVPELIRIGIRDVIERALKEYHSAS